MIQDSVFIIGSWIYFIKQALLILVEQNFIMSPTDSMLQGSKNCKFHQFCHFFSCLFHAFFVTLQCHFHIPGIPLYYFSHVLYKNCWDSLFEARSNLSSMLVNSAAFLSYSPFRNEILWSDITYFYYLSVPNNIPYVRFCLKYVCHFIADNVALLHSFDSEAW